MGLANILIAAIFDLHQGWNASLESVSPWPSNVSCQGTVSFLAKLSGSQVVKCQRCRQLRPHSIVANSFYSFCFCSRPLSLCLDWSLATLSPIRRPKPVMWRSCDGKICDPGGTRRFLGQECPRCHGGGMPKCTEAREPVRASPARNLYIMVLCSPHLLAILLLIIIPSIFSLVSPHPSLCSYLLLIGRLIRANS